MLSVYVPRYTQDANWKSFLYALKKSSEHIDLFPCAYHAPSELRDWAREYVTNSALNKELITLVTTNEIIIREIQLYVAQNPRHKALIHIRFVHCDKKHTTSHMLIEPNGFFAEPWPHGYFDINYNQSVDLLRANVPNKS